MTSLRHTSGRSLVLAVVGLVLAVPARGQERPKIFVPYDGFEAFGHILYSQKLEPIPAIEKLADIPPQETVIIVLGDPRVLDPIKDAVGGWEKFEKGGGAILIACDYFEPVRLQHWKLRIAGNKVRQDVEHSYQQRWEECPLVKETTDPDHPLFKDWRRGLATNRPSYVVDERPWREKRFPRPQTPRSLAVFMPRCTEVPLLFGQEINRIDGAEFIFGSDSQTIWERMVVIANQGVFMNGMVVQEDNDNFTFAWNAVAWLREWPRGNRKYALFVAEGKVVSKFDLPLMRPAPVAVPRVQVLNQMLRGLELENRFNLVLLENVSKNAILRVLLLGGSVVLLLLAGRRIMLARHRLDTGVPLVVGRLEAAPAEPVLVQRQQALLSGGNLWEPAQVLVRQFFLDHAGVTAPLWDEPKAAPEVEAAGAWWQRRALTGQVCRLWEMAQTSPGDRVTPKEFQRLVKTLEDLTAALREGRLRFGKID